MENNVGLRNAVLPFMAGGVLGAGIALVLVPQSGLLIRKMLGKRARRLIDKASQRGQDANAMLESAVEKGKETLDTAQARGRKLYETGPRMPFVGKPPPPKEFLLSQFPNPSRFAPRT